MQATFPLYKTSRKMSAEAKAKAKATNISSFLFN